MQEVGARPADPASPVELGGGGDGEGGRTAVPAVWHYRSAGGDGGPPLLQI
jgi:hypothetical protein